MATGRTVSANHLTTLDNSILRLCKEISVLIRDKIDNEDVKKSFWNDYGKVSLTRDAGAGRGGGKLQRDALCTRGRQGKAPYSNRNLRWHPLVVAAQEINFAKPIERIEIEGEGDAQTFIFIVKINGKEVRFPSDKVHELPERYVVLPEHWIEHIDKLKHWNDTLWTQNSCVIPSMEASEWWDAVEVYAFLAISVAIEKFGLEFDSIYNEIINLLKKQQIDRKITLPSSEFPSNEEEYKSCPVCKKSLSDNLSEFRKEKRKETWQPAWSPSKRSEGEDGSNQILHVNPLIETEIRHKIGQVKFGHRWCNVAMTDHSLEEAINFFEYIVKAHNRI